MTVDQSGGFPTTVVSQTTSLYLFIYNDRFGHTQRYTFLSLDNLTSTVYNLKYYLQYITIIMKYYIIKYVELERFLRF